MGSSTSLLLFNAAKVADHFGFQLDTPWNQLDKDTQKKFLQGTGKEKIDLSYIDERGRKHTRVQPLKEFCHTLNVAIVKLKVTMYVMI